MTSTLKVDVSKIDAKEGLSRKKSLTKSTVNSNRPKPDHVSARSTSAHRHDGADCKTDKGVRLEVRWSTCTSSASSSRRWSAGSGSSYLSGFCANCYNSLNGQSPLTSHALYWPQVQSTARKSKLRFFEAPMFVLYKPETMPPCFALEQDGLDLRRYSMNELPYLCDNQPLDKRELMTTPPDPIVWKVYKLVLINWWTEVFLTSLAVTIEVQYSLISFWL